MREITKGIKEMAKLGFALVGDNTEKYTVRKFVKYDKFGSIINTINYIYMETIGLQVFTNNLEYGYGIRIDRDLLNAIKLNFDELKGDIK